MPVQNINKRVKGLTKDYVNNQDKSMKVLDDGMFRVSDKIKTEYDMWVWIYQEIANLRLEVSRLATYVRINDKNSPSYLNVYHAHVYSLLIPVSTVIPDVSWIRIEQIWLDSKRDINNFNKERISVPNKKVPFALIRKLDKLYRVALLAAQKAGLGIRVNYDQNLDEAIENAITGN